MELGHMPLQPLLPPALALVHTAQGTAGSSLPSLLPAGPYLLVLILCQSPAKQREETHSPPLQIAHGLEYITPLALEATLSAGDPVHASDLQPSAAP